MTVSAHTITLRDFISARKPRREILPETERTIAYEYYRYD
jgi:hypothetical protein